LENTIEGTGKGATSIFPCQIFQLKNGVNTKKNEPNYDLFQLALKCTSKRMYPNYANCDWSNNDDSKSYELKRQFVNSLDNEKQKILKNLISKNEDIGKRLGLTNKLEPITDDPNAMFSTMGWRKP